MNNNKGTPKSLNEAIKRAMQTAGGIEIENSVPEHKVKQVELAVRDFLAQKFDPKSMEVPAVQHLWIRLIRNSAACFIAILFSGILIGCAPGGDSGGGSAGNPGNNGVTCSTLQGHYYAQMQPSITMDVAGNCTFTDSVCGYQASYSVPDYNTGATTVTVINTNGTPGCMSNTAHACTMAFNGVQLAIDCDNGAHQFLFIKQ